MLGQRRGLLPCVKLSSSKLLVWHWKRSNSSSLIHPRNLDMAASRPPRRSRNSMDVSRLNCLFLLSIREIYEFPCFIGIHSNVGLRFLMLFLHFYLCMERTTVLVKILVATRDAQFESFGSFIFPFSVCCIFLIFLIF